MSAKTVPILIGAGITLLAGGTASSSGGSRPAELLVFDSRVLDGQADIEAMAPDGSGRRKVTRTRNVSEYDPTWSPHGKRLLFTTHSSLATIRLDGRHRKVILIRRGGFVSGPDWARRGGRIAFAWQATPIATPQVYTMRTDGRRLRRRTRFPTGASGPAWSPNGKQIAFEAQSLGRSEIFVVRANGIGVRNLTRSPASDWRPAWSSDGKKIAFLSDRDAHGADRADVYVMNANGSHQTRLTFDGVRSTPSWSSDGSRIAFTRLVHEPSAVPDENFELFSINADGTCETRLTRTPTINEEAPRWRPVRSAIGPLGC